MEIVVRGFELVTCANGGSSLSWTNGGRYDAKKGSHTTYRQMHPHLHTRSSSVQYVAERSLPPLLSSEGRVNIEKETLA